MILWLLSIFILAQAFAEIPDLDPNKFTICAMTINSDNERAVFEKEIKKNPKKFNPIVELTEFDKEDWFNKACESKIKCDQLVISGHFGGTFFGSSGKSLPLSELENKGCSKTCEGILSHPYEVFLMGCNTLATKEKDHRTPAQYLQVLLQDGIPQREAEMVVESRYGATGDDNKSKMQRGFSGEKKQLYGFHSVGPSGKNVEVFLRRYFNKSPLASRLEKLQAERMMDKVSFANEDLKDALKYTAFAQCETGASGQDDKTKIICGLRDDTKSLEEKLLLMREAFLSENYLTFIPSVNEFFKKFPIEKMSPEHRAMVAEIGQNEVIKAQMINLLDKTDSFSLLMEWSTLAESLGFIESSGERVGKALKKTIKKGVSLEEKDLICSQDSKLLDEINLKVEDLPKIMRRDDYDVLGCIRPKDKEVHLKIADGLKDKDWSVRYNAVRILGQIKPQDKEVHLKLADALKDEDSNIRGWALWALGQIKAQDKEIYLKVVDALKDEKLGVRSQAAVALGQIRPQDKEIHLKLANLLKNEDYNVRSQAAWALGKIGPEDQEIHLKLVDALKDKDWNVQSRVAWALGLIRPQDKEVHLRIADLLKDEDYDVRSRAAQALGEIKPQDKEIHLKLADALKDENSSVRTQAAQALGEIKPQDKEIQLKLADALKDESSNVRYQAVWALRQIKPQDKEIHLKLVDALKDSSVGYWAAWALGEIKPQDKEIHLKLVDGLKDKDWNVRYQAAQALGQIKPQDREVQLKLVDGMMDKDDIVKESVARSLVEIGSLDFEVRKEFVKSVLAGNLNNEGLVLTVLDTMSKDNKELQLTIADAVGSDKHKVRNAALKTITAQEVNDKDVLLKLADQLKGGQSEVQVKILDYFSKIRPQDKEIQLKIVEQLGNLDNDISAMASGTLDEIGPSDPEVLNRIKELDPDLYEGLTK